MSGGADALLKGMLGIGISQANNTATTTTSNNFSKNQEDKSKKKPKPKQPQTHANTTPSGKTSRGKPSRAGSQGRRRSSQGTGDDNGGVEEHVPKSEKASGKKKKKSTTKQQLDNNTAKTPTASEKLQKSRQNTSSKHNAANYAWSAFQSSPDPSALPDIGGLFGDAATTTASSDDDADRLMGKDTAERNSNEAVGDDVVAVAVAAVSPSDKVRTSLVHSMVGKKEVGAQNAGEALLQRLTSPAAKVQELVNSAGSGREGDRKKNVNTVFRTMESLEAEIMAPREYKGEKVKDEKEADDADKVVPVATIATYSKGKEVTTPKPSQKFEYSERDPITELMNPGGHPGGYGMPMQQQQQQQQQHYLHPQMPYHPGAHPPMHSPYPGYPQYPPPQMQHPHSGHSNPYHHHPPPPQNNVPPGYTTIQVRVPPALGPGNTMLVHGMTIPVPEGVPPGAVIPVMIPLHPAAGQQQHANPNMQQQQHANYYYQQQQHQHMQQVHHNTMMGQYNNSQPQQQPPGGPTNQQQLQSQQMVQHQQQPEPKISNSWAAKVAASSSKTEIKPAVNMTVASTPVAAAPKITKGTTAKPKKGVSNESKTVPSKNKYGKNQQGVNSSSVDTKEGTKQRGGKKT